MFKIIRPVGEVCCREWKTLNFKEFLFPAGEVSVKLNADDYSFFSVDGEPRRDSPWITVVARIQSSDDLMKLAMLKDALNRTERTPVRLVMPYVPYARQDRVCDRGESFSLKVLGKFINALDFQKVTVFDPHSTVTEGVLERLKVISQFDIVNKWLDLTQLASRCLLVSPDAGANKKTAEIAGYLGHDAFIRADKLRDLTNGKIKETIVYCDDLKGRDVLIVDDLCEKGGTFILLAKELRKKNCGKVHLFVSHGVFGGKDKNTVIQILLEQGIDTIWTTDSYHTDLAGTNPQLNVMQLEDTFRYNL